TDTGPVDNLDDWPPLYQDFIADVGGSKFVDVGDAVMHYVEVGPADGQVVLLLHGIPTSAFLWRDVIPQLEGKRVIVPDLVGYGRSERPAGLPYTPQMQVEFLSTFVDSLGLSEVSLVVQDLGGPVGLGWAAANPEQVHSIVMFETLWSTLPGVESLPGEFANLIAGLRTPGVGEMLVGEENVFLNSLNGLTVTEMSQEVQDVYRHPWQDAQERIDVILPSGPLAFPFPDTPVAVDFVSGYQQYLADDDVPKLVIDITPGVLSRITRPPTAGGEPIDAPQFAITEFANIERVSLDGSAHYVQEDIPEPLGNAINTFIDGL
ncbi:MAG: alpha/beta fold hydrolase, partial [Nannocystaceae bacterium]|nr:alpha/beta fold hydrolase [Nannocystaceae bacterium]